MSQPYEPATYWEERLGRDFNAAGVGQAGVGVAFNRARYRAERRVARKLVAAGSRGSGRVSSVLDVGSGTGIWIDFWGKLGVSRVVGLDLTEVAVTRLAERFPQAQFVQANIAELDPEQLGEFDAISAMSVLLHITDDTAYQRALANLGRLLRPGGLLLLVEPLVVHRWWGPEHAPAWNSKPRRLDDLEAMLASAGLEIAEIRPVTWLLSNPIDARTSRRFHALQFYWEGIIRRFVGRREGVGRVVAPLLYGLDSILVRFSRSGPSMKCILVRHAGE